MKTNTTNHTKENTMSAPNSITIDNTKYVRADSLSTPDPEYKIVVLDRGFVYVGAVTIADDFVTIRNAKNVRVWGTTKGLGELAKGPTSKTVTDPTGTVRAPLRALIAIVDVELGAWNGR